MRLNIKKKSLFSQGFQALGDLSLLTDSDRGLDNLTKFVTAQQDKMKKMCDQEKKVLADFPEKFIGNYELVFLNLIILVLSVFFKKSVFLCFP